MVPPDAAVCRLLVDLAKAEVDLFQVPDSPQRAALQLALAEAFHGIRAAWLPVRRELRDAEQRRQREHTGAALGRLAPSN